MNLAISTYALDVSNDVSGGTCSQECSESINVTMKDLTWISGDCLLSSDPGEPTWGGPAPLLNSGNCGSDCTECREFWYSNEPANLMYECVDRTHYKFGASCGSGSQDSCMTDEAYCVKSWDINDPDKWNSPLAKCRTIPSFYEIVDQNDWKFAKRACNNSVASLCMYGCGAGSCHNSWPISDSLRS